MKSTLKVINRMQTEGVIGQYAVGGAVGATFYLEPAATLDIDIFVTIPTSQGSSLLTIAPLYDFLASLGYKPEKEYIVIDGWPVQFLPPSDTLDEEALEQAIETEVEGVRTRVMTAEHLVAIALRTGRPKDYARILQFIENGSIDAGKLDPILSRHRLLAKWEDFGHKFLRGNP